MRLIDNKTTQYILIGCLFTGWLTIPALLVLLFAYYTSTGDLDKAITNSLVKSTKSRLTKPKLIPRSKDDTSTNNK